MDSLTPPPYIAEPAEPPAIKIGLLVPAKARLECAACGVEKVNVGGFDVATHITTGQPVIVSQQTGNTWTIDWRQLIALALIAGIDTPKSNDNLSPKPDTRTP